MTTIRVVRTWKFPDLRRQTPGCDGVWENIRVTDDAVDECDYLLLLGIPTANLVVRCPPQNVWLLCQEPATEGFKALHGGIRECSRIYTPDTTRHGSRFFLSQPALPWFVNRDYSSLKSCSLPVKTKSLSWVTSNKALLRGHRARMQFLDRMRGDDFDLFGRGFREIEDKWDALAPYRYTLAVENHRSPFYFTEKLIDAFLSWTMPIYCGCTNIERFFPADSFVSFDITSPDAVAFVRDVVQSDRAECNRDAIAEARRRVLDKLQFFPFLAAQVNADLHRVGAGPLPRETVNIKGTKLFWRRALNKAHRTLWPS